MSSFPSLQYLFDEFQYIQIYRDSSTFSAGQDFLSAAYETRKLASQPAGTASQTKAMPKRGAQINATDKRIARFTMLETKSEQGVKLHVYDPKPGDLSMIRLKWE